jgi:hypothetical protein
LIPVLEDSVSINKFYLTCIEMINDISEIKEKHQKNSEGLEDIKVDEDLAK